MKKIKVLSFVIFIILISSFISAWIVPDTHLAISNEALLEVPDTPTSYTIKNNYQDFQACMYLTDYSVFLYFTEGFSTIGTVYLASHNNGLCARAVELADKNNPSQLACAYGVCAMDIEDSPSHNGYVPEVIRNSGLVNGIIHAPAEECANKKVATPELNSEGRAAMVNKYPMHKDFLITVFQSQSAASTIDVGTMMDAFVSEVAQNSKYTVGFRGFTAIPLSIHIVLIMYFFIGMALLALLIRKKGKSIINKISMGIIIFLDIIPVIVLYILYATGNIWKAFQYSITPLCWVLPTSNYKVYYNQAVQHMVNFMNYGADYAYQIPDPAGLQALHDADVGNVWKLWVFGFVLLLLAILFIWLNFRKGGKREKR